MKKPEKRRKEDVMALKRSRNAMIAGVCGGIAEWLGWDPTVVRIIYAALTILSLAITGVIVYLVLWLIMPPPDQMEGSPIDI